MIGVRLALVGGHVFELTLPDSEATSLEELVTAAWAEHTPVGHALIRPPTEQPVVIKVSLRDVVSLEITRPEGHPHAHTGS